MIFNIVYDTVLAISHGMEGKFGMRGYQLQRIFLCGAIAEAPFPTPFDTASTAIFPDHRRKSFQTRRFKLKLAALGLQPLTVRIAIVTGQRCQLRVSLSLPSANQRYDTGSLLSSGNGGMTK